jgi:hypothetical protein
MVRGAPGVSAGAWASAGVAKPPATSGTPKVAIARDSPHGDSLPAIPGRRYHAFETRRATGPRRPARVRRRKGAGGARDPRCQGGDPCAPTHVRGRGRRRRGDVDPRAGLVLSLARRPVDYFTFNPWLKRLPAYVVSSTVPLEQKLEKLPALALFWFSSDSPYGGTDWGFAVDVTDAGRILSWPASSARTSPSSRTAARPGSVGGRSARQAPERRRGMLASVVGLSTGPAASWDAERRCSRWWGSRSRGYPAERSRFWRACREWRPR